MHYASGCNRQIFRTGRTPGNHQENNIVTAEYGLRSGQAFDELNSMGIAFFHPSRRLGAARLRNDKSRNLDHLM
jgi:hypothetical protein